VRATVKRTECGCVRGGSQRAQQPEGTGTRKLGNQFFVVAVVIGLALRVLLLLAGRSYGSERLLTPDSPGYLALANNLLEHHVFSTCSAAPFSPEFARTPGYPVFLALCGLLSTNLLLVAVAQAFLFVTTLLFVFCLGRRLLIAPLGLAAALVLYALDITSAVYSNMILGETLFTALITLGAFLWIRWLRTGCGLAGAGVILGIATLVRPISVLIVIPLSAWVLFRGGRPRRLTFRRTVVFAVAFCLPLLPWCARNARHGVFGLSTISSVNLWSYRAAGILADSRGLSREEARSVLLQDYERLPKEVLSSPSRVAAYKKATFRDLVCAHPLSAVRITARGAFATLFGTTFRQLNSLLLGTAEASEGVFGMLRAREFSEAWESASEQDWRWWLRSGFVLFQPLHMIVLLLGLGCLLLCRRGPGNKQVVFSLLLFAGYLLLLPAGPEAESRFRVPAMPSLCLLAGWGLATFSFRRREGE